jgi:hypothetical protein
MRRRVARPYGQGVSPTRLVSLLFALALLWLIYDRARDPFTWRWLAGGQVEADEAAAPAAEAAPENLVPGPNDRDPAEVEKLEPLLELVADRTREIRAPEAAAYWTLMNWARSEPLADLERRAARNVPFIQVWEQPDRYRGKLIRLRLTVRRVLEFEGPERNGVGLTHVYEVWGTTPDSQSNYWCVVLPERPEGLPLGAEARAEVVFVGYFLKILAYPAGDATRGAPLLVGRARLVSRSAAAREPAGLPPAVIALLGGLAMIAAGWWLFAIRRTSRRRRLATAQPLGDDFRAPGSDRVDEGPLPDFAIDYTPDSNPRPGPGPPSGTP